MIAAGNDGYLRARATLATLDVAWDAGNDASKSDAQASQASIGAWLLSARRRLRCLEWWTVIAACNDGCLQASGWARHRIFLLREACHGCNTDAKQLLGCSGDRPSSLGRRCKYPTALQVTHTGANNPQALLGSGLARLPVAAASSLVSERVEEAQASRET